MSRYKVLQLLGLREATGATKAKLLALLAFATSALEPDTNTNSARARSRGQMNGDLLISVVLGLGVAIIVGFVVLFLTNEIMTQINVTSGDPLYDSWQSMEDATNSAYGLFGVLFLIVILSVGIIFLRRI